MPIRYLTGLQPGIKPRLFEELRSALTAPGEHPLIVLVPEQYTLQSEMEIIGALEIEGSFRLQVMSPARLFSRVFSEAGSPDPVRIDERGRVMLMHASLKSLTRELSWYRGAQHRPGFAELAASQIKELKQAGYTPEKLDALAGSLTSGALRYKLHDLSLIWTAYEERLAGRFMDGEDELMQALSRIPNAGFLQGAEVWAYGFELVSPTLANTLVALEPSAKRVNLLLPIENDASSRNFGAYEPVQRSFEKLCRMVVERDIEWSREYIAEPAPEKDMRPDLQHLIREINCFPIKPFPDAPKSVRVIVARNPQDEAMTVMGLIRDLVRKRGWRWRDVAIGCFRLPDYAEAISRCAGLYGVPVFLESRRPADRNPVSQYLLLALKIVSANWPEEEMRQLLRTGYCGVTDEEADLLSNYIIEQGISGRMWKSPFRRGSEELLSRVEPLRETVASPLIALEERLKEAETVRDQLTAVWQLLEETGAFARLEDAQKRMTELHQTEAANECAQVWNRIMGSLDQLSELMAGPRIPVRDLQEMLLESLAATEIKPLPQAGDAVMAGSLSHLRTQPVRLLILMGCNETTASDAGGLFQSAERELLGGEKGVWLAPDMTERGRLQNIDMAAALSLARQFVVITYAQSGAEGGALLPGTMIGNLKLLFPKIRISGGMDEGESLRKLKYASPDAALNLLPAELSDGRLSECAEEALAALQTFEGRRQELTALRTALRHRTASEDLPKELARRLYHGPRSVSITRLEKYAECPFRHFVEYGLRPKKIEPFELKKQDEGTFYHEAMERFLGEEWPEMNGLNIEEAMARMDDITERLLAPMMDGPLGQNPVTLSHSRRMREVARRAARTAAKHLTDSRFEPCALEVQFGEEDPAIVLHTGSGDVPLQGRIDRIDRWNAGDKAWLRIIDYKSGLSELNLTKLYFGLQLQLIIYLAVALERGACRPAGAFYFKVIDPMIQTEERDAAKVDLERTKELRLSGLFINNREVLDAMSPDIEQTVQLTLKPDGTVKQSTRMMDENGFKLLITHAVNAATRIAEGIRQGKTEIAPVAFGSASSCEYCDWRALCQKDPRLGGMPRTLPSIKQDEVLERIAAELTTE